MLKILSAEQIRKVDAYTIANEPISSIDLMERASGSFVRWFTDRFSPDKKIGVVCGTGNNGGDGLAIARLLKELNYRVEVFIVEGSRRSEDFLHNLQRAEGRLSIQYVKESIPLFSHDIIIDAMFGSGLARPIEGVCSKVIDAINGARSIVVAVDVPSGMMLDMPSTGSVIHADFTVSFQLPKLAFLLADAARFAGSWHLVNIGLSKAILEEIDSSTFLIERKDIAPLVKPREKFDHKGIFGHALIVAGSYGKMGACVLAAQAALRAGAGLVTVLVPKVGYDILQTCVPESMVITDVHDTHFSTVPEIEKYQSIGVGPGLGQHADTSKAVENLLRQSHQPLVLDADALNILAANSALQHLIPKGSILTPHPKEFDRLAGDSKNGFERLGKLRRLSLATGCYIILKGAYTAIGTPDGRVYFNTTGNPGMATGGSGDVLTGILAGLLAQGYSSLNCCLLGVYLHGLAGDLAAMDYGETSLVASDLINFLPAAYKKLNRR